MACLSRYRRILQALMLYFFRAAGRTFSQGSSMLTRKDLNISTDGPPPELVGGARETGRLGLISDHDHRPAVHRRNNPYLQQLLQRALHPQRLQYLPSLSLYLSTDITDDLMRILCNCSDSCGCYPRFPVSMPLAGDGKRNRKTESDTCSDSGNLVSLS